MSKFPKLMTASLKKIPVLERSGLVSERDVWLVAGGATSCIINGKRIFGKQQQGSV